MKIYDTFFSPKVQVRGAYIALLVSILATIACIVFGYTEALIRGIAISIFLYFLLQRGKSRLRKQEEQDAIRTKPGN